MVTEGASRMWRIEQAPVVELTENRPSGELELSERDLQYLDELATEYRGLSVTRTKSGAVLRFNGLCGAVSLPSGTVLMIAPKIPAAVFNLLAWRARCPELLEAAPHPPSPDFIVFLLRLLAKLIARLVRQGLVQEYVTRREVLSKLRGRLDAQGELRQMLRGCWHKVACEYDDLTFDCLENQALCRAASVGAQVLPRALPGAFEVASRLGRLARVMRGMDISDDPVDVDAIAKINLTRLNQHYRPALAVAEMLLRWVSIQERASYEIGPRRVLPGLLIDTAELFENAVAEGLKWAMGERWPEVTVKVQYGRQHLLHRVHEGNVLGRKLYGLRPDIVVMRGHRVLAVVDTKYKRLARPKEEDTGDLELTVLEELEEEAKQELRDEERMPLQDSDERAPARADAYQMLAYCIALGTDKAILIYPAHKQDAPPVRRTGYARTEARGALKPLHLWWLEVNCAIPPRDEKLPLELQWKELFEVLSSLLAVV